MAVSYITVPPSWFSSRKWLFATHWHICSLYCFQCLSESFPSHVHLIFTGDVMAAYPVRSDTFINKIFWSRTWYFPWSFWPSVRYHWKLPQKYFCRWSLVPNCSPTTTSSTRSSSVARAESNVYTLLDSLTLDDWVAINKTNIFVHNSNIFISENGLVFWSLLRSHREKYPSGSCIRAPSCKVTVWSTLGHYTRHYCTVCLDLFLTFKMSIFD